MFVCCATADPPRKRVDVVPLSQVNGTPRLSLGNLTEGSPLAPRRALTVQQMYVSSSVHYFEANDVSLVGILTLVEHFSMQYLCWQSIN
jgi:hypothetical protein